MRRAQSLAIVVCALVLLHGTTAAGQTETITAPSFGRVTLYAPAGEVRSVVLFISGDGGWNLGVVAMAERLRSLGALVAGIDVRTFMKSLDSSERCAYPAGALEELSRAIQVRAGLPAYHRPILAGYSSGATLVYAALAAAPSETFAGAISLGFCPALEIRAPLCTMRGAKATKRESRVGYDLAPFPNLMVPWMVLHGDSDQVCAPAVTRSFVEATGSSRLFALPKVGHGFGVTGRWEPQFIDAYNAIVSAPRRDEGARATAPGVADLPLVEVPATSPDARDELAILLSGDGGWAEIDKHIAAGLAARGIPVVGWSSLEYYWTPRTPAQASDDLERVIEHYTRAWGKSRVLIAGYSFGASVAPFLVSRLPSTVASRIDRVALLAPMPSAAFEFHLSDWLGGGGEPQYGTAAEIARLSTPVVCVSPGDDPDSVCRTTAGPHQSRISVGEGHHFGGDYERVIDVILR